MKPFVQIVNAKFSQNAPSQMYEISSILVLTRLQKRNALKEAFQRCYKFSKKFSNTDLSCVSCLSCVNICSPRNLRRIHDSRKHLRLCNISQRLKEKRSILDVCGSPRYAFGTFPSTPNTFLQITWEWLLPPKTYLPLNKNKFVTYIILNYLSYHVQDFHKTLDSKVVSNDKASI